MRMLARSNRLRCAAGLCGFACLLAFCAAANSQQTPGDPVVQGGATAPMAVDKVMMFPETGENTGDGFLWWGAHNGWMFSNVSSLKLIANAYGIGTHQVVGLPRWAETDRYGLIANMDAARFETFEKLTPDEQFRQQQSMAQTILAGRYQLKAHVESREMPVYELVIAGGGLKIAEKDRVGSLYSGSSFTMPGDWHTYGTMEDLACKLAGPSGGIVVDKTGLGAKRFHYELKWSSDGQSGTPSGPSIFTALEEQLGLKLVPATDEVEVLVIDHIEKPTTGMDSKTPSGLSP